MQRRTCLKAVLGTVVAAGVAPRGWSETPRAVEPAVTRRPVPATLAATLSSGTSDAAVAFVLQRPDLATTTAAPDKAALLRQVAKDREKCDRTRPERERAALTLLQSARDPAELASLAQGFGGAMRIDAILPGIQTKELQVLLLKARDLAK